MSNQLTINNAVSVSNGKVITTSRKIAEVFEKNHRDVTRTIETLEIPQEWRMRNFAQSQIERKTPTGGIAFDKIYIITKDGFTLLAMGFTGKKAMQFKIAYIEAFNAMEAKLRERQSVPVQPELPLHEKTLPEITLSMKYKGTPVIPTNDLAKQIGISQGVIRTFAANQKILINGIDIFRIKGVTDKIALNAIKAGYSISPNCISLNLFTASGVAKLQAWCKNKTGNVPTADYTIPSSSPKYPELFHGLLRKMPDEKKKENFTFKAAQIKTKFQDYNTVKFCNLLLEKGYDPSPIISEFAMLYRIASDNVFGRALCLNSLERMEQNLKNLRGRYDLFEKDLSSLALGGYQVNMQGEYA